MSEKKHFDRDSDVSIEGLKKYFYHKGITGITCPLCHKDTFTLTDSMPFVPESIVGVDVRYRLALTPKLVKYSSHYISDQKASEENTENNKIPLEIILENNQAFELLNWANSKEFIILTCEHCGNTILFDRLAIIDFLEKEEKNNGK